MYNEYKIEYSYMTIGKRRITGEDTSIADSAQEAIDEVWNWYKGIPDLRIERVYKAKRVYKANENRWEICDCWD